MDNKQKYGITVLYTPSTTTTFDLVAVHGLNGDPMDTWIHKQSGIMWLRDLLPKALPGARIMTFGYNARFKNFTALQDLRMIASKLLAELVDLRERSRPIVFVCHSLGGIVAKKALLVRCTGDREGVQQAVYGILFLGTPHNGSSLASLGKVISNVLATFSPLHPARALITTLQQDSKVLFEITQDFVKVARKIHLVSFFEMEMTPIAPFIKRIAMEHHSAILNLPDEVTIGQYANHRNIVRFESIGDRNFRPVLSRLKRFEEDIVKKVHQDSPQLLQPEQSVQKEYTIPLDLPFLPCSSFHGRNDVLDKMRLHFYGGETETHRRRSFAICGLGGCGKTQTALHFMFQHQSKYETGILFLNAASKASLVADFERLQQLLGLSESNDVVGSVKRWLAKEEHNKWLMVFDNADNLQVVPVWQYFPATSWGHIIITSRNPEAIGGVAEEGYNLGPLTSEEARVLLLETAGIRQPSREDLISAEQIVGFLGFLPLALNHAGALMRSRCKSPKQYQDLYIKTRLNILKFHPMLEYSESSVLSTWEVNFKQIENESEDAMDLLLLFSFLEPSMISEAVLHRGSTPRHRWDEKGEVIEVQAEVEGVDGSLVRLIQDEMAFDAAIEKLRSVSFVSCSRETNGMRNFTVHPLVQECAVQRMPSPVANKWRWQAVLLICHAFPRNRYLEPLNGEIGRSMLPQLSRVLVEYDKISTEYAHSLPLRREIAATLLASSRFSDSSWKMEALARAKELLKHDSDRFLNAWLTYRESVLLRMSGRQTESDHCLEAFVQSNVLPNEYKKSDDTPSYNAQRGELVVSFAENLIREGKHEEAQIELNEWSPLDPNKPSTLERITARARNITLGKALRYQGHFQEAVKLLEGVLEESRTDDCFDGTGWYRVLLANIADLYCELGRPCDAQELLQQELEPMIQRGTQDIATGRRLRISLAEAFFQQDTLDKAEEILLSLKTVFEIMTKPNHATQIVFFRVRVNLARVYHRQARWGEALSYWAQALEAAGCLKMDSGFHAGIIRYSMAHVLHVRGEREKSHEMLLEAKRNIASETRVFWVAGFSSQWHDYIVRAVEEECNRSCGT
ncbi:hypothetical protein L211DRAFT_890067 [Terfezia boudieri ATCC MYA-4762]|uniref:Uncharacterized protein n=1 Tax=Terfezia boudieri ATCC MYA-4762 TaxID=1051890 RepID=A0A3N4LTD0_9PEZI|nr:hypothetical protein L211DRAFT_890067 [Terfezia boudieri ATCC MYA-4762]